MKAPVLGLIVATAAFGASSLYLWQQLKEERVRADEFAAKSVQLNARIAELEKARTQFAERHFMGANEFGGSPGPGLKVSPGAPPPGEPAADGKTERPRDFTWGPKPSPERMAAMQKIMRGQMRANNKRLYADVGAALGLNKEQANKLIDLLTDQQLPKFEDRPEINTEEDARKYMDEAQRKRTAELTDLLGADKVASLEEYQKSLPARQELDMLARQLEGYDAPLNEDQRKRLLSAMVQERERVPAPVFADGMDPEEYRQQNAAWQEDYSERVSSQARSILNTEQATAFTEYQQAHTEMRSQFGPPPGGPGAARGLRYTPGGPMFTSAVPVGATQDVAIVTTTQDKK